uniref:TTF-type domain-containing protein n=1 Tax=Amaranthus palmeri TaxID=107608 RepID=A0A6C0T529_AMAPA|nr:hypothetical protein AP_R.00g000410-v1.0.a3 [Amaranthus palmeri]
MNTQKNITSFFKRTVVSNTNATIGNEGNPSRVSHNDHHDEGPSKVPKIDLSNVDTINLERDPGLRPPMWFYPPEKRDEVRRAYLKMKPYQPILQSYPFDKLDSKTRRRFQSSWFDSFKDWLEYSPAQDAAFCLKCYLCSEKPNPRTDTFTRKGYKNWKKVNDGKKCAFLAHIGEGPCSPHNNAVQTIKDLLNQKGHIPHAFEEQSEEQIKRNRLRLDMPVPDFLGALGKMVDWGPFIMRNIFQVQIY